MIAINILLCRSKRMQIILYMERSITYLWKERLKKSNVPSVENKRAKPLARQSLILFKANTLHAKGGVLYGRTVIPNLGMDVVA